MKEAIVEAAEAANTSAGAKDCGERLHVHNQRYFICMGSATFHVIEGALCALKSTLMKIILVAHLMKVQIAIGEDVALGTRGWSRGVHYWEVYVTSMATRWDSGSMWIGVSRMDTDVGRSPTPQRLLPKIVQVSDNTHHFEGVL